MQDEAVRSLATVSAQASALLAAFQSMQALTDANAASSTSLQGLQLVRWRHLYTGHHAIMQVMLHTTNFKPST
jgi:hypothetical protein